VPTDPLRLCLFGAPWDTGNRGVEALGRSAAAAIATSAPGSRVIVFDNGWGVREPEDPVPGVLLSLAGVRQSRRYHRRESWANVRLSQRLGGLGNPVARAMRDSDAVLDVSGGDSFSDIYGMKRFTSVLQPKLAALDARRPLVLLPQTYGPFADPRSRRLAAHVVAAATLAYSRDADSHGILLDLLGPSHDPSRHLPGVDMAFGLPTELPRHSIDSGVLALLADRDPGSRPVAGINVSGLIWNSSDAQQRFDLALDYRVAISALVETLCRRDVDVVLVPHVRDVSRGLESDRRACVEVRDRLPGQLAERVHVVTDAITAPEVKWVVSRCDWFCGTRMHATIAGLSSGVATAAIAYSMKTRGVFATCDVADQVVDARASSTADAVATLLDSFESRAAIAERLTGSVGRVVARAREQIDGMCSWITERSGATSQTARQ
jgi:colanic acid/amylovoran biosynthesis protein